MSDATAQPDAYYGEDEMPSVDIDLSFLDDQDTPKEK